MKSDKAIRRETQARYRKKVAKLQRAGLLGKVNLRLNRDPKAVRAIIKYNDYLSGKVAAVKAPDKATARELSTQLGLKRRGETLLVPREKRETNFRITKSGELKSQRPNPLGGKITRTTGKKTKPPKEGERVYYTIRERRRGLGTIKRTTFAKFDDLLEYLAAYDLNWEDVEPYFETETLSETGKKARGYDTTIRKERSESHKRWARRRRRKATARKNKRGQNTRAR
jgi:hypothetical protein